MVTYLSDQQKEELASIAQTILTPGKGILAADESTGKLNVIFSCHLFFVFMTFSYSFPIIIRK